VAIQVRTLGPDDADELFRLRRTALLDSPLAFSASPEDDLASSEASTRDLLRSAEDSVVLGAFVPALVGMIGLHRMRQRKMAHRVGLWGMFVLPQHRREGIARELLQAAIRRARSLKGVESIHLSVTESAVAARRLYEAAGFESWGIEPDAIRFEGRTESERHMRLELVRTS
jgi:ribosomal protein S18 acetylase RimI-like enzyme